jgi:acylphosphatase
MPLARTRVFVEGRVQGVWFREGARQTAESLGVAGWVRNLADGRVEAVFEGPPDAVAQAVAWARRGPERALVTSFEAVDETPAGLTGFAIKPTYSDG